MCTVRVTTESKTDGCYLVIRDDGDGLSPVQCESLTGNVVDNVGPGMNGVMIAHAFSVVKPHQGTMNVRSEEGGGDDFYGKTASAGERSA